ncbi:hypothetical protein OG394_10290 [Kribbella sp. NBC_01245]|uniref:hypothetical protein n=1 Tax=Kribbella sp. NBC_01245 TaxID=2903578 RepID=UPI002E292B3F|nr:hypothetical protein [Kribbella sp. NBC_01245]
MPAPTSSPVAIPSAGVPVVEPVAYEFTVRASYLLHGLISGGSVLVAIGFAMTASASPAGVLRWIAAAAFAGLAVTAGRALLVSALLVADEVGIRLRAGDQWIGARWEELEEVTVLPRRHVLDDGRIALHLEDPGPVVAAFTGRAHKLADANRRLTGSSLAVPFGLTARPSDGDVLAVLRHLADGRCPIREQL